MSRLKNYQEIWQEAIERFPVPSLKSTGRSIGQLEPISFAGIIYSEEFTFDAGWLINHRLISQGWIKFMQHAQGGKLLLQGDFIVTGDDNVKRNVFFTEFISITPNYDIESGNWSSFNIGDDEDAQSYMEDAIQNHLTDQEATLKRAFLRQRENPIKIVSVSI
jgi:hypothetical protein